MKNDINKYLSMAAIIAGSAFMVSCDGSDGSDGSDGVDGISGDLPVAAPTVGQIPLAELTAIVDTVAPPTGTIPAWSDTDPIQASDVLSINFQSTSFAEITEDGDFLGGLDGTNNNTAPITYTITAENQFVVTYENPANIAAGINADPVVATFTVESSDLFSLTGSFVSGATTLAQDLNINADPAESLPVPAGLGLTAAAIGGGATNLTTGTGIGLTSQFVVPADVIVVGNGDGEVFIRNVIATDVLTGPAAAIDVTGVDFDALDAAAGIIVENAAITGGGVITDTFQQISVFDGVVDEAISGTFRIDLSPSSGNSVPQGGLGL